MPVCGEPPAAQPTRFGLAAVQRSCHLLPAHQRQAMGSRDQITRMKLYGIAALAGLVGLAVGIWLGLGPER